MSKFLWSESAREYRHKSNGRAVSQAVQRGWIEQAIKHAESNLERLARELASGSLTRPEWAIASGEQIKHLHRSASMLANGGRAQMTERAHAQTGGVLRRELSYFNRFASEVDNVEDLGEVADQIAARAKLYSRSGRSTFQNAQLSRERSAPDTEWEQRHLGASVKHCDDCIAQAALGKQPPGTLNAIGQGCACNAGCHCYFSFGRAETAAA